MGQPSRAVALRLDRIWIVPGVGVAVIVNPEAGRNKEAENMERINSESMAMCRHFSGVTDSMIR